MSDPDDPRARCTVSFHVDEARSAVPARSPVDALPIVAREVYARHGELARGGLGRITAATDRRMGRPVALKEPIDPAAHAARFVREALLTARLQHPGIVPVYEAGAWPDGTPFFAMKRLGGENLDATFDRATALGSRLALLPRLQQVAEALAHAHALGVVHRDVKPGNVLCGEHGEVAIVDWGAAVELAAMEPGDLAVIGTPAYMAPEQAAGAPPSPSADVYAMGALLYRWLAGRPPYEGTARSVLDALPVADPPRLAERCPEAPRDLVAIVDKAMRRDPVARYPTARELADDLGRFATGRLVEAHRYSPLQRAGRWMRRHRAAVATACVALLALVAVGGVALRRVLEARDRAEEARALADHRADALVLAQASGLVERDPAEALRTLGTLSPAFRRWGAVRTIAAAAEAAGPGRTLPGTQPLFWGGFSPDGTRVASGGDGPAVHVWEVATGRRTLLSGHRSRVSYVAWSPDGARLYSSSADGRLGVWDVGSGRGRMLDAGSAVTRLFLARDGRTAATMQHDGAHLWDLAAERHRALPGDTVTVRPCCDGGAVGVARNGTVRVWDRTGRGRVAGRGPDAVSDLQASADGREVAVGTDRGVLWLADLASGRAVELGRLSSRLAELAFSRDGAWVATGSDLGAIGLWHRPTRRFQRLEGHRAGIESAEFSPDGQVLATASRDGTVRLWQVATGRSRVLVGHRGAVGSATFAADGGLVASMGYDRTLRLWPAHAPDGILDDAGPAGTALLSREGREGLVLEATGHLRAHDLEHARPLGSLRVAPGASVSIWRTARAGVVSDGRSIARFSLDRGVGPAVHRGEEELGMIWLAGDSERLVATTARGVLLPFDASDRLLTPLGVPLEGRAGEIVSLAADDRGDHLAALHGDGTARVYALGSGALVATSSSRASPSDVALSGDGRELAVARGEADLSVLAWPGPERRLARGAFCYGVFYSPDDRWLASCCGPSGLQLHERATGRESRLEGLADACRVVAFGPGGDRVAAGSGDGGVRIWDLETGEGRTIHGHQGPVRAVAFSSDGRRLYSAGRELARWDEDLPAGEAALRAWLRDRVASLFPAP